MFNGVGNSRQLQITPPKQNQKGNKKRCLEEEGTNEEEEEKEEQSEVSQCSYNEIVYSL